MTRERLRQVLLVDSAFELVLGVLLVLAPLTGLDDRLELPWPMTTWLYVVAGIALFGAAATIHAWSRTLRPRNVGLLAAANDSSGVLLVVWVLLRDDFTTAGAAFVIAVAAVLFALAAVQAVLLANYLRESRSEPAV